LKPEKRSRGHRNAHFFQEVKEVNEHGLLRTPLVPESGDGILGNNIIRTLLK
jgi:hypothetical protein